MRLESDGGRGGGGNAIAIKSKAPTKLESSRIQ